MKIRITALMLAVVMLLTLLSGCGAADAELEATTVAATEALTTEPTMEPTTEPTEPPTALEQLGYELWEDANDVIEYDGWERHGVDMPISRARSGNFNNYKVYFSFTEDDGRVLAYLLTAPISITIYEFPASSFDDDIDWIRAALEPFYRYCKEQETNEGSFEEWVRSNQNKKLLYLSSITHISGRELISKAADEGFARVRSGVSVYGAELVNPVTGEWFNTVDGNYDPFINPKVGCWKMSQCNEEILALRKMNFSDWYGEYNMETDAIEDMYVLLPAKLEDICFAIPEFAIVETVAEEEEKKVETEDMWETGSILEDYVTEERNFYFVGLD